MESCHDAIFDELSKGFCLELLKKFGILRLDSHPEKKALFWTIKNEELAKNEKSVKRSLGKALGILSSADDIEPNAACRAIAVVMGNLENFADLLATYQALTFLLNEEAISLGRHAVKSNQTFYDVPPEPQKAHLRIVKKETA